jgi:hypothetical protein
MKRASRIVLTCIATTGACSGAAVTIGSIATASTTPTAAPAAVSNVDLSSERAELRRQAGLLDAQIALLSKEIAAQRRGALAGIAGPGASLAADRVIAALREPEPAATNADPRYVPPAPALAPASAAEPVAVQRPTPAPPTAAPIAIPTTPPPVQTTTGASGSTVRHTSDDGGSDD